MPRTASAKENASFYLDDPAELDDDLALEDARRTAASYLRTASGTARSLRPMGHGPDSDEFSVNFD